MGRPAGHLCSASRSSLMRKKTSRADFSGRIGDSPDEFERFLAVLRFAFSKELKFVRARLGKPYNSALGRPIIWRLIAGS